MGKLTKAGFARAKKELGLKGKLTRKQVQRVFKRAIKKLGRTERRVSKTGKVYYTKPKSKRSVRKTAKKRRRRKRSMKIPLATVAGIIAGICRRAPSGRTIPQDIIKGDIDAALYDAKEIFTGFDLYGKFRPEWLVETYGPMIVGALISKFVGGWPINLNRKLKDIPFIKI